MVDTKTEGKDHTLRYVVGSTTLTVGRTAQFTGVVSELDYRSELTKRPTRSNF